MLFKYAAEKDKLLAFWRGYCYNVLCIRRCLDPRLLGKIPDKRIFFADGVGGDIEKRIGETLPGNTFLKSGVIMCSNHNKHFNWKSILMIIFGNILYAFTVKFFLLPSNLMSSGTTGIALVVNHLTDFSISTFILCFNVAALLLGLVFLGRKFVMTTIASSLCYPVLLEVLNRIFGEVLITENMMLNTLFSGMGLGMALGIVIRAGASTGGMDIPPLILNKYFRIPVSISLYVFDFIIIVSQVFYHPLEDLLYGVLLLIVTSVMLDKTILMGSSKTEVKIVSKKSEEIRREILTGVDRGVTILNGEGGYLREEAQIILSVVSNYELAKVEKLVRRIDPECFMIVSRVTEVWGKGFSIEKYYEKKN